MKTGIYSGSFNPIHRGHTALADYLLRHTDLDEIWLVVSPQNPLKNEVSADNDRLTMARLAAEDFPQLQVSDVEFSLPKPSYTIDTLRFLNEKYPENEFVLIIGADNLAVFHLWKDFAELLDNYRIIVYPRKGFEADLEKYPQVEFAVDAPLFDVSSTEIRRKIKAGEDVSEFLTPKVYKHIETNHLYR
ncbi:putative nicotinate-nucleotide adenylyltransferase [Bacteroidia bacterium]|nr:putative nicotinate-nucleotide adenylyltransferase [Bacteroidia bacterium]